MDQDPLDLGETLFRGASRIHRLQVEALAGADERLTLRQFRTLQRVQEGFTSPSDLSRLAHRSLPTTSETIDGLVRRGLLERTPSPDRRVVVLKITPTGRKAYESGAEQLARLNQEILSWLSARERPQFEVIMGKVLAMSEDRMRLG